MKLIHTATVGWLGLGVRKSVGGHVRRRARMRALKEVVRRTREEKARERKMVRGAV